MSDDHIHDPDNRQETTAGAESKEAAHEPPADDVATAPDDQLGRSPGWGRRDLFRALASVPVFGALAYSVWRKTSSTEERRRKIFEELGVTGDAPAVIPQAISNPPSGKLRLGVVGYGGRGQADVRGAGFAPTEWTDRQARAAARNRRNQTLETWMAQHDLHLELTSVCDLFDVYAERGLDASTNSTRPGGREQTAATRYRTYEELLDSGNVDLII